MAIEKIIYNLSELQEQSNKRLKRSTVFGIQDRKNPRVLVKHQFIHATKLATKPIKGAELLLDPKNTQSLRKIRTMDPGQEGNFTSSLNTALLGGQSYPILDAVIGATVGVASGFAGLLFSAATTALDLQKTSQRVLARSGDEIWHVEEIGKVRNGSSYKAVYVSSYFIVDPFRGHSLHTHSNGKGWLIHEEREELTLD
jgi:hypothetical protein